uniref:NADH-ubiquinone oxidoreductase chain 4 n=2 Tax=Tilletia TaxID=13289 RepID=A8DU69_9BASI|nr:NADH dehydrogenase subunit 4 [Tilletia indica]YP_001876495.1 ND4 [Tilletia walkeri]ABI95833.1 NADH dehydrogenase subunit 4 [Tilletia indica]ABP03941.1 ND4 [Tilletia walkeri]APT42137.1 NADH dehydrogenase subunit 4 [Tilletia indica]
MKNIALLTSLINFIVSIILWGEFDSSTREYQFVSSVREISFCYLRFGIDGISLYFVLLTTFIIPICILSNWDNIQHNMKFFLINFLLLETLLIAVFTVCDLLLFYIFFESVLIPLFLIVGIWGGSSTRIRAAFLLFLYTLFGSLFMLLSFLYIYYNIGTTDFQIVSLSEINPMVQKILWIGIFISMAIKTPIWPLHLWLFRAHAEAPVGGSVILAGLILKLRLYGYLRILIPMFPDATSYFSPLVQTMALISIIYASLSTVRQTDFKALVAYSSVAHMGVVVLGVFSNTIQGIEGSILLGIAHGLVSPALFILVGGVLYDRYHTRVIMYYRGLTTYMPIFSIMFFLFTIRNTGIPLSANWVGEMMSLMGAFQKNNIIASICSIGIVLSARYSIWLYNRVRFGSWSKYLGYTKDLNRREFMLLLPLLITTFLFGIFPNRILNDIHVSVSHLIYSLCYL